MRRLLSPLWLALSGLGLLVVVFLALWLIPSNTYIFLPDQAHPVGPLVRVQGGHDQRGGGIYFVDIFVRKASLIERLWPGIHEGAELVPKSALLAPGTSDAQRVAAAQREMTRSQQIAAAVALRAAGYRVPAQPTGALVEQVALDAPAAGKLLPTDVIVGAAGRRVRSPADLRRVIGGQKPGSSVRLNVRRGKNLEQVVVRTIADPSRPKRSIIGIFVDQAASIDLPLKVKIDAGDVGGPSAGLAFALEVLEKLGKDVDHGRRIAATGQIELDGSVSAVGGRETEDDRCSKLRDPVLPRPGWGKRRRGAALRARCPGHPCAQFSTGVAQAGNADKIRCLTADFVPFECRGNCCVFICARVASSRHGPNIQRRRRTGRGACREEQKGKLWPSWRSRRAQIATSAERDFARSQQTCPARRSGPTRAAHSRRRSRRR